MAVTRARSSLLGGPGGGIAGMCCTDVSVADLSSTALTWLICCVKHGTTHCAAAQLQQTLDR
jgi:hypothetical protein